MCVPAPAQAADRDPAPVFRDALTDDIDRLVAIENAAFATDRLSRRQFRWMLTRGNAVLRLVEVEGAVAGYLLLLFHRGTSLARLYSIAVAGEHRGRGLGAAMLAEADRVAIERDCVRLRLEVHPDNSAAIALYKAAGYLPFGVFADYYQDHSDALRFEKRIHIIPDPIGRTVPYYAQTLDFTCGPASLIMAMQAIDASLVANRSLEIQLWREATTIYMTSGHGGCSPQGLALAAQRRGFRTTLLLSQPEALFLEGVRKADKKAVLQLVHDDFSRQIAETDICRRVGALDTAMLIEHLEAGNVPMVLISSYRFNASKAPHWVVVAGADNRFVYLHDPDADEKLYRSAADSQYIPVSHEDFDKMIRFGANRTQAAVCLGERLDSPADQISSTP